MGDGDTIDAPPRHDRLGIAIPCFNEAERLDPARVAELLALLPRESRLVFVDDGSTDATATLLDRLATGEERIGVLALGTNRGKAEAVRLGLAHLAAAGCTVAGFTDADFATPPEEIARLARLCLDGEHSAIIGSRVALLGHRIERHPTRHYAGRLFATAASLTLGFEVYDTQCGCKFFRSGPALRAALAEPFTSRWSFDVELLGRLTLDDPRSVDRLLEVPLREWHDVAGSKMTLRSALRATADLWSVRRALRARRAR